MKRMTSSAAEAFTYGGFGDDSPTRNSNANAVSGELSPQRKRKVFADYASPPRRKKKMKAVDGPRKSGTRVSSPGKATEDLEEPVGRNGGHRDDVHPSRSAFYPRRREEASNLEDLTPPRRRKQVSPGQHDLSPPRKYKDDGNANDSSPPRQKKGFSPEGDMSPPRRRPVTVSPRRKDISGVDDPPIEHRRETLQAEDLSPPRKKVDNVLEDVSPTRRRRDISDVRDLSPPRRRYERSNVEDFSPPRRSHGDSQFQERRRFYRRDEQPGGRNIDRYDERGDNRKRMLDGAVSGLRTDKDIKADIERKRKAEFRGLEAMDASQSGRGAETTYRDKRGKRLEGLEEMLRQQEGSKKPESKPLEWGKGLVQKREVEQQQRELEAEASKPFARTRDDPELDKALRDKVRWGDPMAHLVKKPEPELEDIGAREDLKDSGFNIPQEVPQHSWIKRGKGAPPNRYGIKPGRHWDGVDRSNGFEQKMFKQKNEKIARDQEAYAWSVADM